MQVVQTFMHLHSAEYLQVLVIIHLPMHSQHWLIMSTCFDLTTGSAHHISHFTLLKSHFLTIVKDNLLTLQEAHSILPHETKTPSLCS